MRDVNAVKPDSRLDPSPNKWILGIGIVLYYLFFQTFYNLIVYNTIIPGGFDFSVITSIFNNFIPTLICFCFNYLIVFKIDFKVKTYMKFVCDCILSLVCLCSLNLMYIGLFREFDFSTVNWGGTIFNDIYVLLFVEVYHYTYKFKISVLREEEARMNELNYKYNALISQINPHFLFNSLNGLYMLIPKDSAKSQQMVLNLVDMYRYILTKQKHKAILLTEELGFLDSYEQLMALRSNNCFHIVYTGRTQRQSYMIVPFTLQLLIENVIKHNVISSKYPMKVEIIITDDCIQVINPIRRKRSVESSSVGLTYLVQMYAQFNRSIDIIDDGKTFEVRIPFLPQKQVSL